MSKRNYVNGKDLFDALCEYKTALREAEEQGTEEPRIPEYVGECILKIATKLATKSNFSGYTYKDEMISDGIENCILYLKNFDPEKSTNAFAYITQIIYFAFIRRIDKEKKQRYILLKNYANMSVDESLQKEGLDLKSLNDISDKFIESYETTLTARKNRVTMKKKSKL
jgi:DNA-directed RNA polymerase specialized sigma subunit